MFGNTARNMIAFASREFKQKIYCTLIKGSKKKNMPCKEIMSVYIERNNQKKMPKYSKQLHKRQRTSS